jgi:hypothetical protein
MIEVRRYKMAEAVDVLQNKDLQKIVTRVKDLLPILKKRVEKISKYAKKVQEIFVKGAGGSRKPPRINVKALQNDISNVKMANETLYHIAELQMRLDHLFKGRRKPKSVTTMRKKLQDLSGTVEGSIKDMEKALSEISRKKIPFLMKKFGDDLFKGLEATLVGKKVKGHAIALAGERIHFVYYLQITGKLKDSKVKRTVYVTISQLFDKSVGKIWPPEIKVFRDQLPKPPFKGNMFKTKSVIGAMETIPLMIDALGLPGLIKKRPKMNKYKPIHAALVDAEEKYPAVMVKDNVITIAVKRSDVTAPSGKVAPLKLQPIILDATKIFNAKRRKLGFLHDVIHKSMRGIGNAVVLRIRFYPARALKYVK